MAAGDTLQGRRVASFEEAMRDDHEGMVPGAYWSTVRDGKRIWMAVVPTGGLGDLSQHDVVENADGTITVAPSILLTAPGQPDHEWHGYLERGVWREV